MNEAAKTDDAVFEIGAAGVDTTKLVEHIRATVARKRASGVYSDARVGRAEKTNLRNLSREEDFLSFYLECLRDAVYVDINDFEIVERRRSVGPALRLLKKTIWGLLKFYTYRLWSQQNQVNGLLLNAVESTENRCRDRIKELEERIARLEAERQPRG